MFHTNWTEQCQSQVMLWHLGYILLVVLKPKCVPDMSTVVMFKIKIGSKLTKKLTMLVVRAVTGLNEKKADSASAKFSEGMD